MDKLDAIRRLGGTPTSAAAAIRITVSAVTQWPAVLTPRLADRVIAAEVRKRRSKKMAKIKANDEDAS